MLFNCPIGTGTMLEEPGVTNVTMFSDKTFLVDFEQFQWTALPDLTYVR